MTDPLIKPSDLETVAVTVRPRRGEILHGLIASMPAILVYAVGFGFGIAGLNWLHSLATTGLSASTFDYLLAGCAVAALVGFEITHWQMRAGMEIRLDSAGLHTKYAAVSTKVGWDRLAARETSRGFVFSPFMGVGIMLAKRALAPAQVEHARTWSKRARRFSEGDLAKLPKVVKVVICILLFVTIYNLVAPAK